MTRNEMADRLEELADVILLNGDHWLSNRRVKHMVALLKENGFDQAAVGLDGFVGQSIDDMATGLRQVAAQVWEVG